MKVEMFVGLTNNTWVIEEVELSDCAYANEQEIEIAARDKVAYKLASMKDEIAFFGLYHIGYREQQQKFS